MFYKFTFIDCKNLVIIWESINGPTNVGEVTCESSQSTLHRVKKHSARDNAEMELRLFEYLLFLQW